MLITSIYRERSRTALSLGTRNINLAGVPANILVNDIRGDFWRGEKKKKIESEKSRQN